MFSSPMIIEAPSIMKTLRRTETVGPNLEVATSNSSTP
jgi:hypothetical protein